MRTVFTNGCFDVVHYGHVRLLEYARSLGDYLIVGLNSDASIKRLKGEKRPINHQHARKYLLQSIRFVDDVIIFDEDTPARLLTEVRPDVLVKGGDYKPEDIIGYDFVKSLGGEIITVPLEIGYSTTNILDKI